MFKLGLIVLALIEIYFFCLAVYSRLIRPTVGLVDQRFQPCSGRPNCVSSQTLKTECSITPLSYSIEWYQMDEIIKQIMHSMPRYRLVSQFNGYWHYACSTNWLGFVDDLEIYLPINQSVVHFRSASRVGYSDLGVNRRRIQKLKKIIGQLVTLI